MESLCVLIVEHSARVRKVLSLILKLDGYEILTANSSDEAIQMMMTTRPDLILIEASMPGMDGYAVCRWVRTNPAMAHVPVVMLSGEPDAEREHQGRNAGVDASLTKPVNPSLISKQVRAVLQRRSPRAPVTQPHRE